MTLIFFTFSWNILLTVLFNAPWISSIVNKLVCFNSMKPCVSVEEVTHHILIGHESITFTTFLSSVRKLNAKCYA